MKNGICPKCQSSEVYWHKGSRNMGEPVMLKDSFFGSTTTWPDKYACASCGYIEYYLPTTYDLQTVQDNWTKVTP